MTFDVHFLPPGHFEEIPLQRRLRFALLDHARSGLRDRGFDLREQLGRGVFEDQLGLVLDRDQFVEPAFTHERALVQDADAVADFLHLAEQMRAEQHGDAALFEIEDEVANLARAGGIDAGGRLIEHEQPRLLDHRLREADALEHPFRVAAEAPVRGIFQPDQLQQFLRALAQLRAAQAAQLAEEMQRLRRR